MQLTCQNREQENELEKQRDMLMKKIRCQIFGEHQGEIGFFCRVKSASAIFSIG